MVEELESGDLLFSRSFSRGYRPSSEGGDAVPSDMATKRIASFIAWANQQAIRLDRPHEIIPEDPEGPVVMRRSGGPSPGSSTASQADVLLWEFSSAMPRP